MTMGCLAKAFKVVLLLDEAFSRSQANIGSHKRTKDGRIK